MTAQPNALLLIGSAKPRGRSTSESLGRYLCSQVSNHGWGLQTLYVHMALRTESQRQAMLAAVDAADLVVLATPLYVDSLPYLVTDALERIAAHRTELASSTEAPLRKPRFVPIVNCGFPEAEQNDVAIDICREFACIARLEWAGGLSMGGGGVVHGLPLDQHGPRAEGIRNALAMTADVLATGLPVPDEAAELLARPAIPPRLYTVLGNIGWHATSWRAGTHRYLHDRPFDY